MNADQFRLDIVRPALKVIDLWSQAAENLVMGTAAQESRLEYVRQLGDGPALSFFQIEPVTHDDIWDTYLAYRAPLAAIVRSVIGFGEDGMPTAERLVWDMRYATVICRLKYRRSPLALPEPHDIWGLATMWKQVYNTPQGKGTAQEFVDNYQLVQVSS